MKRSAKSAAVFLAWRTREALPIGIMLRYILPLVTLILVSGPLCAQTPEQVVTSYFEKMKTGGINTVAGLMHPDELRKFREMLTPVIEGGLNSEGQKALFQKFADPKDATKMRVLDDGQFMNLFMEWVESVQPGVTAALKGATVEALGHVSENDVKHVVVRMKVKSGEIEIEKMSVLSVKDDQGVPKLILTGEMKGMAEALKRKR
jgi:hypothetical protein